jgi:hypothetical protein
MFKKLYSYIKLTYKQYGSDASIQYQITEGANKGRNGY